MSTRSSSNQFLRRAVLSITLAVLLVVVSASSTRAAPAATTRHVATTGTDTSNSCTDSGNPCKSIQRAVNVSAASGDTILVAAGTYSAPQSPTVCPYPLPASVVCIVDTQITIRGGYTTSNWNTSNYDANVTIIDGGGSTSGIRGVLILGLNNPAGTNPTMQGFTIQNSRGVGPFQVGDPSGFGGGMQVASASVTLLDMKFKTNNVYGQAGAGGRGGGAAVAILGTGGLPASLLQRVTFEDNQSFGTTGGGGDGFAFGALYVTNTSTTIDTATFLRNKAVAADQGAHALGGAISVANGTMILRNITATDNQALGGDISNGNGVLGATFGGAIHAEGVSSFSLSDSTISNNLSLGGSVQTGIGGWGTAGGISMYNSSGTIDRTYVISNTAQGGSATGGGQKGQAAGGGLYLWEPSTNPTAVTLTNVIISENLSTPGATGNSNNQDGGGGIKIQGANATLNHVTIARNRLGSPQFLGQGMLVQDSQRSATVNVNYSIIAHHTLGATAYVVDVICNSHLTFNQGLFAANTSNRNFRGTGTCGPISGQNSMVQGDSAGFLSDIPPYNYHITVSSLARDQATGSSTQKDIDGNDRPYNGTSDHGADEYTGPPPILTPRAYLPLVIR